LAVAMGAFATSQIVFLKEIGFGAVVAVLVDAFVVRALLVPSLMALLGDLNWWSPRALRRLHARVALGEPAPAAA
ncbi:MAG TPA: MMPL family transporter, partial [Solirubrobacteraceae bacterium]